MKLNFFMEKNSNKKSDNQPMYVIKVKNPDPNGQYKSLFIGGAWLKEFKDGTKYFSCTLDTQSLDEAHTSTNTSDSNSGQGNVPEHGISDDEVPF